MLYDSISLYKSLYLYKFMVTKFPYMVYSWPISRRKRLSEMTTNSPPCHRHFGTMTSSYKYTTLCIYICPLNHYRRCKTVPAANLEKSTNLGEVCGKCHVMSPLPHTKLELEMPRATIWLWLSFAAIYNVYHPTNVHWYNIVTNRGEFVMKKQVGPSIQLLR